MPETAAKPRYAFVDLAKGICIMLVVWHHVASTWGLETYPLKEAVSLFRMPLYFFLSGLFFKEYAGFLDFARRKVNKLLIPFAFFFVVLCCIFPFVLHYFNLRANPGAAVWYSFVWKQNFPNIPVWFLLSLFWTNLIFYGLYLASKKFPARRATAALVALSVAVGLAGFFLGRYNIKLPLFWASSMAVIPYFCAGHIAFRTFVAQGSAGIGELCEQPLLDSRVDGVLVRNSRHVGSAFVVEGDWEAFAGVLLWSLFHHGPGDAWLGAVGTYQNTSRISSCALAASGIACGGVCRDHAAVFGHYPVHEAFFATCDRPERRVLIFPTAIPPF